ncbi:MAG: hypothetical protein QOD75_2498 [Blastocatellia bacterium]|jgi:hypothetical protein|nr:hypothetical protein [Blastocatellia bacterium]
MPEREEQFSDETIRRFLLGALTGAEQATFDERLFADDGLEKRVRLAECELADDYAFERLNAADQELFEHNFMVTAARHQQLTVSEALRDRFASETVVTSAPSAMTIAERLKEWLGLGQSSWKLALRVIILLLLIGTMWSVLRGPRLGQRFLSIRRPVPAGTPAPNLQMAHHSISPEPPKQITPPDQLAAPVTLMLVPQHGYDPVHIATIMLPDGERGVLRLQLSVKGTPETDRAELLTISGQSVLVEGALKPLPGVDTVSFDVPGRFLTAGDYQMKLSRRTDGVESNVVTYYFRVQ